MSTEAPTTQAAVSKGATAHESGSAPGKGELRITVEAVDYARKRLKSRGTPDAAVRLGIKGGGCSGFSYVIEFSDDDPRSRDIVHAFDGVKFYVDKKSMLYLGGSTLDYEHTLMFQGFQFKNPLEASRCGCGHSFTVR